METPTNRSKPNLLRVALLANAVFSLTTGSGLVLFADRLALVIGQDVPPALLQMIGLALIPFGGFAAWLGSRRNPDTLIALGISLADLGWVAGSGLLLALAYSSLSATGVTLVIMVAGLVLGFAVGQMRGIARAYSVEPGDWSRFRVCFDIRSDGEAGVIWRNLANLGEIARFAPTLSSSHLLGGMQPAHGAVRTCTDRGNRRWSERCVVLNHECRELVMEFLTHEPGFPFPFVEMTGGWAVKPEAGGTLVRVWWAGRPKFPALNPVILPLLAWQARRQFPGVVRLMSEQKITTPGSPALLTIAPC